MANRFQTPRTQHFNNPVTGAPLSGGQLWFYASGTLTPLNTYSDTLLTIANTNPVILNSAGMPSVDIFLQNFAYTVVLQDSNSNTLWSADNVYTSDFSTVAVFGSYLGNPNGFVAGTAGGALTNASVIWDRQNNILYVCTSTGNAASAVWFGVNTTAATTATVQPQGYLTLTSVTVPVIVNTTGTSVFYTPYTGNLCPIWNGSSFSNTQFNELTLNLTAGNHIASAIYDVFLFNNSGVVTIGTGPAWSVATAGSGARGTGAGTTQLSRTNGIWTNTGSITLKNGATSYAGIAANQATYVGSLFIDISAGQVTCHVAYGQSRKWGVWNAYNRLPIYIKAGDGTAQWTYNTGGIRSSNGNAANNISVFTGLPEERVFFIENQQIFPNFALGALASYSNVGNGTILLGLNSVTVGSGTQGIVSFTSALVGTSGFSSASGGIQNNAVAEFILQPTIGVNVINMLENGTIANNMTNTFFGTETNLLLLANYRG